MSSDPRGAEQVNVAPKLADLPPRFWVLIVLTGIGAGLGAMVMMGVLRAVQHLAFGYHSGEYSTAVAHHSDLRLVVVLAVGGLVTGVGLWIMRRFVGGTGGEPTEVVWTRTGNLSLVRTLLTGALSELSVAMGCSIGREAAPQRTGAAAGAFLAKHFSLPPEQRRLLIACGAGAGLAAVYNVPFAGALFSLEIYLGTLSLPLVLPALLTAGIATAVSWITLPAHSVYAVPTLPSPTLSLMVFAVLLGPVMGVASAGYVRMIAWASDHRPKGWLLLVEPVAVFTALGFLAISYPLLLGNGVDLAQFAFTGSAGLLTLLALSLLKPVATSACLRSGATGGLFTPTMSFGAVFGALLGHLWILLWPGPSTASYAVVGAAALLTAAIEAPATGIAMTLELTHTLAITAPILVAAVGATVVSRRLEIRSIYSARLSPPPLGPEKADGHPDPRRASEA
ncbi:MAG: chloride channel protein [Acidimicrobiales bacterium]